MRLRKSPEAQQHTHTAEPFANDSAFTGDFTYFVGLESMNTGVGMNIEDSQRYADATRRAIRNLYPELNPTSEQKPRS